MTSRKAKHVKETIRSVGSRALLRGSSRSVDTSAEKAGCEQVCDAGCPQGCKSGCAAGGK